MCINYNNNNSLSTPKWDNVQRERKTILLAISKTQEKGKKLKKKLKRMFSHVRHRKKIEYRDVKKIKRENV